MDRAMYDKRKRDIGETPEMKKLIKLLQTGEVDPERLSEYLEEMDDDDDEKRGRKTPQKEE